jgi:predicted nucleic acid-binding protein
MVYITIDTCSWLNLISEEEFNPQIELLNIWVEQNEVQILIPEKIILEWDEHKEKKRKSFVDSWNTKKKHAEQVLKKSNNNILPDYTPDLN